MSQMALGDDGTAPVEEQSKPRVPRHRIEILATQIVAFTAPGFESWSRAPVQLKQAAMQSAEEALTRAAEVYDELEGRKHG